MRRFVPGRRSKISGASDAPSRGTRAHGRPESVRQARGSMTHPLGATDTPTHARRLPARRSAAWRLLFTVPPVAAGSRPRSQEMGWGVHESARDGAARAVLHSPARAGTAGADASGGLQRRRRRSALHRESIGGDRVVERRPLASHGARANCGLFNPTCERGHGGSDTSIVLPAYG